MTKTPNRSTFPSLSVVTPAAATILTHTTDGAWTLGRVGGPSEVALEHRFFFGKAAYISAWKGGPGASWMGVRQFDESGTVKIEIGVQIVANGFFGTGTSAGDAFISTNSGPLLFSGDRGTVHGSMSAAGSWTFPISTNHVFGGGAGVNTCLSIRARTSGGVVADTAYIDFYVAGAQAGWIGITSGSSNRMQIRSYNTLEFLNSLNGVVGKHDDAGGWTLGPSSPASGVYHSIIGFNAISAAGATQLHNKNTATDSASLASPVISVNKWSSSTAVTNNFIVFTIGASQTGNGCISANSAGAAAFQTFSDVRLKENIEPLSGELTKICALNPVEFDYKTGGHQVGFIAQEMVAVYPEVVGEGIDGMLTVTGWDKTSARLVKAIQELKAENDALKERVEALEG